jgi:hypothetical protein
MAIASARSLGAASGFFTRTAMAVHGGRIDFELAAMLLNSAVVAWASEFFPDAEGGKVGGWTNAANLGSGVMGARILSAAAWLSFRCSGSCPL